MKVEVEGLEQRISRLEVRQLEIIDIVRELIAHVGNAQGDTKRLADSLREVALSVLDLGEAVEDLEGEDEEVRDAGRWN